MPDFRLIEKRFLDTAVRLTGRPVSDPESSGVAASA